MPDKSQKRDRTEASFYTPSPSGRKKQNIGQSTPRELLDHPFTEYSNGENLIAMLEEQRIVIIKVLKNSW